MSLAQLACEVVVMHMCPQLLTPKEVDLAKAAEGMGRGQMSLQLLVTAKQWQLQWERPLRLHST